MRIFSSLCEAHKEIERDLFEVGVWISGYSYQDKVVEGDEGFDFMELSPYVYSLTDWSDKNKLISLLELSRDWLLAEFAERVGGVKLNPGEAWKLRRDVWEQFLEPETGRFAYTYASQFAEMQQLERVASELQKHPQTRQAIVGVHDHVWDILKMGAHGRIPCSMFYQFMIRNGALNMHYVMRSCDFHTHWAYDTLLGIRLLEWMALQVGRPVGVFTHLVTSLHGFRKNFGPDVF